MRQISCVEWILILTSCYSLEVPWLIIATIAVSVEPIAVAGTYLIEKSLYQSKSEKQVEEPTGIEKLSIRTSVKSLF